MTLIYILFFLVFAVFATVVLLFLLFVADVMIYRHDLPTSRRATRALVAAVKKYKSEARNFYDLGCAHGALALRVKKAMPKLNVYAIDKNSVRIFFAKLRNKFLWRGAHFKRKDIFEEDLSETDVVYTYLWYDLMPILEKKCQKELKRGAVVITNTSHFQDWQPAEKIVTCPQVFKTPDFETLFVYVKG